MKTLITYALAFLCIIVVGCSSNEKAPSSESSAASDTVTLTPAQEASIKLAVERPSLRTLGSSIRVHGLLQVPPQYLFSVTAPLGGRVVRTNMLPGSYVRKGATLAVLEDVAFVTLQEQYLTETSELDFAKRERDRQAVLAAEQVNAQRQFEQAEREYQVRRIRQKSLAEQLALLGITASKLTPESITRQVSITAPFDGYVTRVLVNTGTTVAPQGQLLEVVDPSHMHVELSVFEHDAQRLQIEQPITIQLSGDTTSRPGHVHLIGTRVNNDRTIDVHAHLDRPDPSLRPGTTLTAMVHLGDTQRLAVPLEAVVVRDGVTGIWRQTATHAYVFQPVVTGIEEDGWVELVNANQLQSAAIVVKGAHRL